MTRSEVVLAAMLLAGSGCVGGGPTATSSGGGSSSGLEPLPRPDTTSSSGTGTSSSSAEASSGERYPDLPPYPEACLDPMPTIVMKPGLGPEGPVSFDDAYLAESVCEPGPFIALYDSRSGQHLRCMAGLNPSPGIAIECGVGSDGPHGMTIELLEPFEDPVPGIATVGVHLHARVVALGEGWDVVVEVDVPDCGDEVCTCPCE